MTTLRQEAEEAVAREIQRKDWERKIYEECDREDREKIDALLSLATGKE